MRPSSLVAFVLGVALAAPACITLDRETTDVGTTVDAPPTDNGTGGDAAADAPVDISADTGGPDISPPDVGADTPTLDGVIDVEPDVTPDVPDAVPPCPGECPNDGNPCTEAVCNPQTGSCDTFFLTDGTACGEGVCNQAECQSGVCLPALGLPGCCESVEDCFSGAPSDPCTDVQCINNQCVGSTDSACVACYNQQTCLDAAAQMGNCTTGVCDFGSNTCSFETPGNCGGCMSDSECFTGDPCTAGTCNFDTGACLYTPVVGCCNLDSDCPGVPGDDCFIGKCTTNQCTVEPSGNCPDMCSSPSECDDGDPCTLNLCQAQQCVYVFDDTLCTPTGGCNGQGVVSANNAVLFSGSQAKIEGVAGIAFVTHSVTIECPPSQQSFIAEAGPVALKGSFPNHVLFTTGDTQDPAWECIGACAAKGVCTKPHAGGTYWAWGEVNPPDFFSPYLDGYGDLAVLLSGWCIAVTPAGLAGAYDAMLEVSLSNGGFTQESGQVQLQPGANGMVLTTTMGGLSQPQSIVVDSLSGVVTLLYPTYSITLTSDGNTLIGEVSGDGVQGSLTLTKLP